MNYFFVDFENVHTNGLEEMDLVEDKDIIYIFYSDACKNITLEVIENLNTRNIELKAIKVTTGTKNALDFQMVSFIGYLIGINDCMDINYYIVSKDSGYDAIVDFWKKREIIIERIVNLSNKKEVSEIKDTKEKKKPDKQNKKIKTATKQEMQEYLNPEEYSDAILNIFNKYKSKQAICNGIAKELKDSKQAGSIYKKLKPLLKEKNKS